MPGSQFSVNFVAPFCPSPIRSQKSDFSRQIAPVDLYKGQNEGMLQENRDMMDRLYAVTEAVSENAHLQQNRSRLEDILMPTLGVNRALEPTQYVMKPVTSKRKTRGRRSHLNADTFHSLKKGPAQFQQRMPPQFWAHEKSDFDSKPWQKGTYVGKRSAFVETLSKMSSGRGTRCKYYKPSACSIQSVLGLNFSELNDRVNCSQKSATAFAKKHGSENVYGADKYVTHEVDGFTVTHRVKPKTFTRTDSDASMSDETAVQGTSTEATSKHSTIETAQQESTEELDLLSTFKFGFADVLNFPPTSRLHSDRQDLLLSKYKSSPMPFKCMGALSPEMLPLEQNKLSKNKF